VASLQSFGVEPAKGPNAHKDAHVVLGKGLA